MCQIEMEDRYLSTAEENMIFQSTYAEATQTKSSKVHGHGYLAKHRTRKVLLQENVQLLARNEAEANSKENAFREEVARLKAQLANEIEEREREKEESTRRMQEELENAKKALKEEMKQEFLLLLGQHKETENEVIIIKSSTTFLLLIKLL